MGVWVDHLRMIIQMNDSKLRTIEQIELFLSGNIEVAFSMQGDDPARYAHISRVIKPLDYPQRNKRERGVVLRYLQHTSDYSRSQITRLVTPLARQPPGRCTAPEALQGTGRALQAQIPGHRHRVARRG